ncbi:MAG: hypothetical protein BGO76_00160 [Caedibacter sp. 38-128]|nr:MAG: hypothetical protein BGO76_00160 [Caedibacter sp. 38-128]
MNIYTYLKKDHQKVAALFDEIINANSQTKRESFFRDLKKELLLHAESEHATFYKALKSYPETKEIVQHADKEHAEVKEYLDRISDCSRENAEWLVLVGELKHSVEHHVEEEESEMFKKARSVLDEETEKRLVNDMEGYKEKLLATKKLE